MLAGREVRRRWLGGSVVIRVLKRRWSFFTCRWKGTSPARCEAAVEGVVRKAPMIHLAAKFCACRSGSMRVDCFLRGLYQMFDPYVSRGRTHVMHRSRLWTGPIPRMEFPRRGMARRVLRALLA